MNEDQENPLGAYLWDPAAGAHDAVVELERKLAVYRFDPDKRPFRTAADWRLRAAAPRARWRPLAMAATVALVAGAGFATWRWTWPDGRAWMIESGPRGIPGRLRVGETLYVPSEGALVRVARIGSMRVGGGSALTLRSTRATSHRLSLERGSVRVRVFAPPFSVVFDTPAGRVADLGCTFDLEVDGAASRVHVGTGWVQLENDLGETLVPAGASAEMHAGHPPYVPVFDDAPERFRAAVRALEGQPADVGPALDELLRLARRRDVLTLLMLVNRGIEPKRLARRAAGLHPPPAAVSVDRILQGDTDALWRWHDALPLPPPKRWWLNWRDALPQRTFSGAR